MDNLQDNNLDNDSNFQVTVKTVSIAIITLYTPQRQFSGWKLQEDL